MTAFRLFALPIGLVLASVAIANVVSVSQKKLSVGTSFDVTGTDFKKRPAVWLDLDGRKIPLRVAKGGTDTLFRATLASIPNRAHGDCVLQVRPRGARIPFALVGLSIELPSVAGVAPLAAKSATEVTIDGSFFGARKGRVDVGAKHAKVISWTDTQIHALVPKGLAPGDAAIVVTSRAGASLEPVELTVTQ